MRLDKLTTAFQQALGTAQSLAVGLDASSIDTLHVLHALIDGDEFGGRSLIVRSGGNINRLLELVKTSMLLFLILILGKSSLL